MEFFIVYKENGKMQYRSNASEYTMLSLVAEHINSEDILIEDAYETVQYVGFLPTKYDDIRKYVDYAKEKNLMNQPILVIFHLDRFNSITKIFRRGIPELTNYIKSSHFESVREDLYSLNKDFKSFNELIDDTTRNSIGRLIMNKGLKPAVSELKYEYVGAKISIKSKVPVTK